MLSPGEHYKRATNLVVAAADFEQEVPKRAERMVARAQVHALLAQCGGMISALPSFQTYPATETVEPTGGRL